MRTLLEWALLGIAVLAGSAWAPSLPLQIEDFPQLAQAEQLLGPAELLGDQGFPAGSEFIRFFRPALHASFWLDRQISGTSPFSHHLWSLLWHALVVFLLRHAALRFGMSRTTSLGMALVFAVHPAKSEAVTWIAARGDLLAAAGLLLAIIGALVFCGPKHRPARSILAIVFGLAAALAAKESGLVFPLAIALIILSSPRAELRGRRRLVLAIILAGLVPLLFGLRRWSLGPNADTYGGAVRVFNFEIVGRMIQDLPGLMVSLTTGHYGTQGIATITASLLLLLATTSALVHALRGPLWPQAGRAAAMAAAFAVLLAPGLRLLEEGSGVAPSRMHYLPSLIFLPTLAFGVLHYLRGRPAWRRLGVLWLVLFVWLSIWSTAEMSRRHLDVARIQKEITEVIDRAALEVSGGTVVVLDLPYAVDRVPLFGRYLNQAFRPPYRDEGIRVLGVARDEGWFLDELVFEGSGPVRFLSWSPGERTLVPLGIPMPALSSASPSSTFLASNRGQTLTIRPALALRRGRVLELKFAATPASAFESELRFKRGGHRVFERRVAYDPTYGASGHLFIDWSGDLNLLAEAQIDEIEWIARQGEPPPLSTATVRARLPVIAALAPNEDQVFPRDGEAPCFRIDDPGMSPLIRLRVHTPFSWSKIFARELLVTKDGQLEIRLNTPGHLEAPFDLRWEDFRQGVAAQQFDRLGVRELELIWSIEGIRGQSVFPESRSERRRLILGR